MSDEIKESQATPNATLEQQITDPNIPKNEREWWAFREIERLRAEIERLTLDGIHTCHDECTRPLCVARRENARLRQALTIMIEARKCEVADTLKDAAKLAEGMNWRQHGALVTEPYAAAEQAANEIAAAIRAMIKREAK